MEKGRNISFSWTGVDRQNQPVSGELSAQSLKSAKVELIRKGIRIRRIHRHHGLLTGLGKPVTVRDVVTFSRQLSTMITAGIPISNALQSISGGGKSPVKTLVDTIRQDVESGTSLSSALSKHPKHFDQLYVGLTRVGEESGTLDSTMERIATNLEQVEALKRQLKSALFYPTLVIAVSIGIVAILLTLVIPEFESLFVDFGAELPALTKLVVSASHTLTQHGINILLTTASLLLLTGYTVRRSAEAQRKCETLLFYLPIVGGLCRKSVIARITSTLAVMFGAGVNMVDALQAVSNVTGSRTYQNGLLRIKQEISAGQSLSQCFNDTRLFPTIVIQMIATGEESGELQRMLSSISEFYKSEVDSALETASRLIEPILIVILGLLVGTIVIAMYLPIFQLGSVY